MASLVPEAVSRRLSPDRVAFGECFLPASHIFYRMSSYHIDIPSTQRNGPFEFRIMPTSDLATMPLLSDYCRAPTSIRRRTNDIFERRYSIAKSACIGNQEVVIITYD